MLVELLTHAEGDLKAVIENIDDCMDSQPRDGQYKLKIIRIFLTTAINLIEGALAVT